MNHLSLTNLTRSELPRLPFRKITEKILSKKYSLSVVFTGNKRAARLNKKYRGKNYGKRRFLESQRQNTSDACLSTVCFI